MQLDVAQLIQVLPIGVYILDAEGTAVYANDAAMALLGRAIAPGDRAENLGKRYAAYRAGTNERYPTELMPIIRALGGERSDVDDMEIERDGERVALEVTAAPIYDDEHRVVFAVAVFQDITERKRIQALERANRAKSVFLMNISHELRTPLNHVIGFTELLADRIDDPRSRRLAETASASGRDLLDKINDLIELARAEAEAPERTKTAFDFDALLHRTADAVHMRCDSTRIGAMQASEEAVSTLLRNVFERAGVESVLTARGDARRVVVSIASERLVARVRALSHLFGEVMYADGHFQQRDIDFRLAVARAQARRLGGDIVVGSDGDVEVVLPL